MHTIELEMFDAVANHSVGCARSAVCELDHA